MTNLMMSLYVLITKRIGFKRYAYRNDRYGLKRDFKLYERDDCSACSFETSMHEAKFEIQ